MSASALRAYTKELADTDGSDLTKEDIEWAAGLSDEQAQGATRRAKLFKAGQEYFHDVHGHGAVKAVAAGFVVKMHFKDGDQDFRLREHGTLRLIVQDADNYTAESLFKLADTDGSGHINLAEFTFIHAMMKEAQEKHERLLLEVKKTDKAHKLITGSLMGTFPNPNPNPNPNPIPSPTPTLTLTLTLTLSLPQVRFVERSRPLRPGCAPSSSSSSS